MAKYDIKFSCGHTETKQLFGKTKDRDWQIKKWEESGLCSDCYRKSIEDAREKANEAAAAAASKLGLPDLIGTEKQVAWATTVRQGFIDEMLENLAKWEGDHEKETKIFEHIIENKLSASWWIDRRDQGARSIIIYAEPEIDPNKIAEKQAMDEIKIETTVVPDNATTESVAEISVSESKIKVDFKKNDTFISIVKKLGYKWEGTWAREINKFAGPIEHRAAEIGNALLCAGIPVRIADNDTRDMAIHGTFEPEATRRIALRMNGEYAGWLVVEWARGDDLYNVARKLPGSRYDRPNIVVKPEHFKEIEDFANLYEFKLSEGAKNAIENAKSIIEAARKVKPVVVKIEKGKDGLKEILDSSEDVIDDLKD